MRTILTILFFAGTIGVTSAQDTAATKSILDDPMLLVYLVTAMVFVVAILVGVVGVWIIRVLNILTEEAAREKAEKAGVVYKPEMSWWSKLMQQANASVPLEEEKTIELDHNFDGIKELDNHLPPWWKWLFYGTIAWSLVYIVAYHVSDSLPLSDDEYQQELSYAEEQAKRMQSLKPRVEIDPNTLTFTNDGAMIEHGKKVFMNNNCGSCHGREGGGNSIGPNLTDEYWLHGGHIKNIFTTVKDGFVEKGMPAWGKAMSPEDVRDVTFFIMSLQGTKPTNAKAPQGELFKAEPVVRDSTQASL